MRVSQLLPLISTLAFLGGCAPTSLPPPQSAAPAAVAGVRATPARLAQQIRSGLRRFFDFADGDKDAVLSSSESVAMFIQEGEFACLDQNDDFHLTFEEASAAVDIPQSVEQIKWVGGRVLRFADLDVDRSLSEAEFLGYAGFAVLVFPHAGGADPAKIKATAFVQAAGGDARLDRAEVIDLLGNLLEAGHAFGGPAHVPAPSPFDLALVARDSPTPLEGSGPFAR